METTNIKHGKRYTVYSVRKAGNTAAVWVKAGYAWGNRDGSVNVSLEVLPVDGKLHIRDTGKDTIGDTVVQVGPRETLVEKSRKRNRKGGAN